MTNSKTRVSQNGYECTISKPDIVGDDFSVTYTDMSTIEALARFRVEYARHNFKMRYERSDYSRDIYA